MYRSIESFCDEPIKYNISDNKVDLLGLQSLSYLQHYYINALCKSNEEFFKKNTSLSFNNSSIEKFSISKLVEESSSDVNESIIISTGGTNKIKNKSSKKSVEKNSPEYRVVVNDETSKPLRNWLEAHITYPYPDEKELKELMRITNFTKKQVRGWFTNHRRAAASLYEKRGEPLPWIKKEGIKRLSE